MSAQRTDSEEPVGEVRGGTYRRDWEHHRETVRRANKARLNAIRLLRQRYPQEYALYLAYFSAEEGVTANLRMVLDPERDDRIADAWVQGRDVEEIAGEFQLSRDRVRQILDRQGVRRRGQR